MALNWVVASDIHMADFSSYEFYPGFRREQYPKLAHRLVEIGRESAADTLVLTGDILDSPINRPIVEHMLKGFFDILCDYYKKIHFITGQHDRASKTLVMDRGDTVTTLYDNYRDIVSYSHDQMLVLPNGRHVYFRNWCPTHKLSDIPECDIFFSHITLNALFGQEVDGSRFKIGLFGDIHDQVSMGNMHSVGNALQKGLSDSPDLSCIVLDTDSLEFKRVPLITDKYKFLRIYRSGKEVNSDEFTWIRESKVKSPIDQRTSITSGINHSNFKDMISAEIDRLGFSSIHSELNSSVTVEDFQGLDFQILEFVAKGFRSLDNFEMKFDPDTMIGVSGLNGSGKSSLRYGLCVTLFGDSRIRRHQSKRGSALYLSVTLKYHDIHYKIERSPGWTRFSINGVEQSSGGKRGVDALIYENLPFLHYLGPFMTDSRSAFFHRFNKTKLLNRIFNLEVFQVYLQNADKKINELSKKLQELNSNLLSSNGNSDRLASLIKDCSAKIKELSVYNNSDIEKEVAEYSALSTKMQVIQAQIQKIEKTLSDASSINFSDIDQEEILLSQKDELFKKLDSINKIKEFINNFNNKKKLVSELVASVKKATCPNCASVFDLEVNPLISKYESDLSSMAAQFAIYAAENTDTQSISTQLSKITSSISNIAALKNKKSELQKSKDELSSLTTQISEINQKISVIQNKYANIEVSQLSAHLTLLSQKYHELKLALAEIDKLNSAKVAQDELSSSIKLQSSAVTDTIKMYSNYRELFIEGSEHSLYHKVLVQISQSLSDDQVSLVSENTEDSHLVYRLNVDGVWMDYEECSDGQKTLMDLKLMSRLSKLIGNVGLIIFDESLGNLDSINFEKYTALLRDVLFRNMIHISHNSLYSDCDTFLNFKLVDGITVVH